MACVRVHVRAGVRWRACVLACSRVRVHAVVKVSGYRCLFALHSVLVYLFPLIHHTPHDAGGDGGRSVRGLSPPARPPA